MAPLIIDKEAKKKQILRAALAVFSSKGYYGAKIADIADEAGIGKGTVYEYFRTKEGLFMELFTFLTEDHHRLLTHNLPPADTARQKLEDVIAATFQAFDRMEKFYCVFLDLKTEHVKGSNKTFYNEQFAKLYREFRSELGAVITLGQREGSLRTVNPDYAAALIIAAMEGLMNQWIADQSAFPLKEISAEVRKMILGYLTP